MRSFCVRRNAVLLLASLGVVSPIAFAQIGTTQGSGSIDPPAGATSIYKQIAGPPSDFLGGAMSLPDPKAVGVRSNVAMLPVRFEKTSAGWSWEEPLRVSRGNETQILLIAPRGLEWEIRLRDANGRSFRAEEVADASRFTSYGWGGVEFPARQFSFARLAAGDWTVSVGTIKAPVRRDDLTPDGFLLVSQESASGLYVYHDDLATVLGTEIGVLAYGFDRKADREEGAPKIEAGVLQECELTLFLPSGTTKKLAMLDDGAHRDGRAGDGVFGVNVLLTELGDVSGQAMARGIDADGVPFVRTAEVLFPVVFPELSFSNSLANVATAGVNRFTVHLPLSQASGSAKTAKAFAELWGTNAKGETIPICWIGGIAELENDALPLGLDARWIGLAGAQAPFELRNVRVQEVETEVPLAIADQFDLAMPSLPASALQPPANVNEEMIMGPRPPSNLPQGGIAGSYSKLLLVHGYCSTDVWGPVQSHFTDKAIFYDLNRNRTHNTFANLILSFGNQFNSYGVVAHSQGGCASLHLYTYYWSGLDNATGPRLIQSVGTPYQGTALAGNLAAIGSIFGVGCGTNSNLTHSGAASWLSGIPYWARGEVNYYTTSFTDNAWVYDYCSLATDLLLTDPDDGVTAKIKGQLSGGINRGHTTGWCHTASMRDPAQTTSYSRNSTMNVNAAR